MTDLTFIHLRKFLFLLHFWRIPLLDRVFLAGSFFLWLKEMGNIIHSTLFTCKVSAWRSADGLMVTVCLTGVRIFCLSLVFASFIIMCLRDNEGNLLALWTWMCSLLSRFGKFQLLFFFNELYYPFPFCSSSGTLMILLFILDGVL